MISVEREFTGLLDRDSKRIYLDDTVKVFETFIGKVTRVCGAYGVVFLKEIDWDFFDEKILKETGCDNKPCFCRNDNFISFWELAWNYNYEDNWLECIIVCEEKGEEK